MIENRHSTATGEALSVADAISAMDRERTCGLCGQTFVGIVCGPCSAKRREEAETADASRMEATRKLFWQSICPVAYRDTDLNRIHPTLKTIAETWEPGGKTSIVLAGDSGEGKTRAGFHILWRFLASGRSVYALHAGDAWDDSGDTPRGLSSAIYAQFSNDAKIEAEASSVLSSARAASFLLLDDIGKERESSSGQLSPVMAEALFNLIEYRAIHGKATILTSNMAAKGLALRFPADKQQPLRRRLIEFYTAPPIQ